MLYRNYPTIEYPFLDGKQKLAVDILKRFRISDVAKRQIPYWEEYILQDEDTPEVLANVLYDDANLSWLVLMVNSVINPNKDWMKSDNDFDDFITNKWSGKAIFLRESSLNHKEGNFEPGAFVYQKTSTGDVYKAEVIDWNRTLRRLIIDKHDVSSWSLTNETLLNSNKRNIATITRVVDFAYDAVHQFEDSDGEVLNTLDYIDSYAESDSLNAITIVTEKDYERRVNESKRSIVLVRPEFVSDLLYHIEREIAKIKALQTDTYITKDRVKRIY